MPECSLVDNDTVECFWRILVSSCHIYSFKVGTVAGGGGVAKASVMSSFLFLLCLRAIVEPKSRWSPDQIEIQHCFAQKGQILLEKAI
jgi:hypothetical protein